MQFKIQLTHIRYSDIAAAALPYARQTADRWGDSTASVIAAMTGLPAESIRGQIKTLTAAEVRELVDAVPEEKIRITLSAIVTKNRGGILDMLNGLSAQEGLGITASSISLSADLTAVLEVSAIDYPVVVEKFLSTAKRGLLKASGVPSLLRPMIEKATPAQICALLEYLPGSKDAALAMLINQNQRKLISKIQEIAEKNGVRLTIASLDAKA